MLRNQLRPAILLTLLLCAVTGLLYPAVLTAIAQFVFPIESNGSLITVNGRIVGSRLIGQSFTQPYYFHPRPSAAGSGYDATASAGTNKGSTDRKLADSLIAPRIDSAIALDGATKGAVPSDMVTASGSGLDPDISPASAQLQITRVAVARGVKADAVRALVEQHITDRQFSVLGEPRVNVLELNIALDQQFPRH